MLDLEFVCELNNKNGNKTLQKSKKIFLISSGQNMAYLEARILIALILQKFTLKLVPNQTIEQRAAIVLLAKNGIKMVVEKRRKNEKSSQ